MTNYFDHESLLAELSSSGQKRRAWIQRMNSLLPAGRNRWFFKRSNARRAAYKTVERLTRKTGQPFRVNQHIYKPYGLRHFHISLPDGRHLRMRFIYLEITPSSLAEREGESGRPTNRANSRLWQPPKRYGGRVIDPVTVPRTRPAGYRRPTGVALPLTPAQRKRISTLSRAEFKEKRPGFVKKLSARKGEDIHHAIELQVLKRYPGVFTQTELNQLSNMRGIPAEKRGKKALHGRSIRDQWNYAYRQLDAIIAKNGLRPGTPAYNQYVRDFLFATRDAIDWGISQFFTEQRRAKP